MIQIWAILTDSLRLLRSRSLFWISIGISALAAIALFGTYTFDEQGIRFLWMWLWENQYATAGSPGARSFVSGLFNDVYVGLWLSFGAIILALVSTASILPDFLASGSVDLSLAKPISRVKLFLSRVGGALLFVAFQLIIGVGLAWLMIGLKFDLWLHAILLAIPLITLQFFYLYCAAAFFAVITRSTLASLIGTAVFWLVIIIVQFSHNNLEKTVVENRAMIEQLEARLAAAETEFTRDGREPNLAQRTMMRHVESRVNDYRKTLSQIEPWYERIELVAWFIPKTGDLRRIVARVSHAPVGAEWVEILQLNVESTRPPGTTPEEWREMQQAGAEGEHALRGRDAFWSIGTSVGFSMVLLGLATIVFLHRDF